MGNKQFTYNLLSAEKNPNWFKKTVGYKKKMSSMGWRGTKTNIVRPDFNFFSLEITEYKTSLGKKYFR